MHLREPNNFYGRLLQLFSIKNEYRNYRNIHNLYDSLEEMVGGVVNNMVSETISTSNDVKDNNNIHFEGTNYTPNFFNLEYFQNKQCVLKEGSHVRNQINEEANRLGIPIV